MTLSRVRANAPIDASTRPRASLRRRTRDKKFTASAQRADDDAYNAAMKAYSASPYEYKHELGLYYHRIRPYLIVGTQPQTPEDVDRLREVEGVTCVFNTQQEKDWKYWNVDFEAVKRQVEKREMTMVRYPFEDFSADSLREGLPAAAARLDAAIARGDTVYLHCTAGMGRSPGLAIAYMYWFLDDFDTLDAAYEGLTSIRPCGPKKESIRGATCDVLAAVAENRDVEPLKRELGESEGKSLTNEEKQSIRRKIRSMVQSSQDDTGKPWWKFW